MKKKIAALAFAGLMSCTALTGCGSKDKKESSKSKAELSGSYCPIDGVLGKSRYTMELDKALSEVVKECSDKKIRNITFSGDKFRYGYSTSSIERYYSGTYQLGKSNDIYFDYSIQETVKKVNGKSESTKVGVDDYVELTDAEKKKLTASGTSSEEKKALNTKLTNSSIAKAMIGMNETGTFTDVVKPRYMMSDKYIGYVNVLPQIIMSNSNTVRSTPVIMTAFDDFLCIDIYGLTVNGSYNAGDKFEMTYNPAKVYTEDEYSAYSVKESAEDKKSFIKTKKDLYEKNCGVFNGDTSIIFEDGKWTWQDPKGETINSGKYSESELYPGLVAMYFDESSNSRSKNVRTLTPYYLYISSDQNVYYPGFMKIKKNTAAAEDVDDEE